MNFLYLTIFTYKQKRWALSKESYLQINEKSVATINSHNRRMWTILEESQSFFQRNPRQVNLLWYWRSMMSSRPLTVCGDGYGIRKVAADRPVIKEQLINFSHLIHEAAAIVIALCQVFSDDAVFHLSGNIYSNWLWGIEISACNSPDAGASLDKKQFAIDSIP